LAARGTPADVRGEVRRRVADFASDGTGFVFTQVHNIQPDVPVENIVEMMETAKEIQVCT
jgi:uroporphyrinogen decarboxylase